MNEYVESRMLWTENGEIYLPDHERCSWNIGRIIYERIKLPSRSVVFAFDSVNYFEFTKHFDGRLDLDKLECYTSAFPTGSPTAFSSIFFREPPNKHRIFGIAFYSEKDKGIYQTSKGTIIDSHNRTLGPSVFHVNSSSFLSNLDYPVYYVYVDNFWHSSELWSCFSGNAERVTVKPRGHYKENYERSVEFDELLERTRFLMSQDGYQLIWVFVDLDEVIHQNGVKSERTQRILKNITSSVSDLINEFSEYDYYLFSDHGQVDLKDTYEFPYDKIKDLCYSYRGGIGRTHYFYTKSPDAIDIIKGVIGDTGLVLKKQDSLLKRIYGFDPTPFPEIGDIVAIATKPSFPSYGWKMKAEHGALSKEEVFIPFLQICRR